MYLLSEQFRITLRCMYFPSCQLEGNDFTLGCHGTQSCVVPEIIFLPKLSLSPPPAFTPATQASCPHRCPERLSTLAAFLSPGRSVLGSSFWFGNPLFSLKVSQIQRTHLSVRAFEPLDPSSEVRIKILWPTDSP